MAINTCIKKFIANYLYLHYIRLANLERKKFSSELELKIAVFKKVDARHKVELHSLAFCKAFDLAILIFPVVML